MAHSTRYCLTLAVLVQLTTQNTNISSVCNPAEVKLQHKYCKGSANSSVITNEPDFIKVKKICSDIFEEYKEISEYQQILKCNESENCLSAMLSIITVCEDRLQSMLDPGLNDSISKESKLTEIDDICSPAEIQFQHKYCKGSINSSVIANEPDSIKIEEMCLVLIEEFKEVSEYEKILNCKNSEDCMSDKLLTFTLCLNNLQNILPPEFNDSMSMEQLLIEFKAIEQKLITISYITLGIIFVIGIMTNGLLTIIFVRHKSARNDMMLVNLAVTDILSLILNMTLFTLENSLHYTNHSEIFESSLHFFFFINQYSLVMISVQRFRAISNRTEMRKQIIVPNWVKTVCLWILGSLYWTLHYILEYISNNNDNYFYTVRLTLIILYLSTVIEGVIPVVLITPFCVLASNRLKKLADNFPGERDRHLQRINDRYLASKALIALAMLFVISYVPYNAAVFVVLNYYPNHENFIIRAVADAGTWYWVLAFTKPTRLFNSAFNPLVLYFLSSKFRRYFKSYLCCRTRDLD